MKPSLLALAMALALSSCSTLPRPEVGASTTNQKEALALMQESSRAGGRPYQTQSRVDVRYSGEWGKLVTKVQPILVDREFRKSSEESYFPRASKVRQVHRGPGGEKVVVRTPGSISVTRNGERVTDQEELDAAALVADCYVVFTFGSSALVDRGAGWKIIGQRQLNGESCTLVAGTVRPGFGASGADGVIAWIGDESKRLHRVQLTLFGLESTAGADVDVTFDDFQPGPRGTEWPRSFVERVRRPFDALAHTWRMDRIRSR